MKRATFLSICMSAVLVTPAFSSCGSDNNTPDIPDVSTVKVMVSPEQLMAGHEATVLELSVTADRDWAVAADADWISVQPSGGLKNRTSIINVKITANTGLDERSANINLSAAGQVFKSVPVRQGIAANAFFSTKSLTFGGQESSASIRVTSNVEWELTSSEAWLTAIPAKGSKGESDVTVKAAANDGNETRTATLTLVYGEERTELTVTQLSDKVNTPAGYTLVWSDEFNTGSVPSSDWTIENWAPGHVNNELQTYTSKEVDGKRTLEVKDGFLYINCFKGKDGKVYSGRMNARPSTGWTYGYFEARINLPKGKGTWPAFWMMPSNVDWSKNPWPYCGEIDIMEEVGANPDFVSSSLHTGNYNHTQGTQKTHEMKCAGAEGSFHVYACEWTPDEIVTYVDGKVQLRATKAAMGADHDSWPFHYAFYPILNLAWGGDWGGYKGVDESALPVSMIVDYVRIFQKQ